MSINCEGVRCADAAAIREVGDLHREVEYMVSLLEAAIDQCDSMDGGRGAGAFQRRTNDLVRIAREKADCVGNRLGGLEGALNARLTGRVVVQRPMIASAGLARGRSCCAY